MMNDTTVNLDAERALLGSLMLSADAFDETAGLISAESFHDERHTRVFEIARELHQAGKPVDLVSVATRLDGDAAIKLPADELPGFLGGLAESVPHAAHAQHYAELVKNAADRRHLSRIAHSITSEIPNPSVETLEIITTAEQQLHRLMESGTVGDCVSIADVLLEMQSATESAVCTPTGFSDLDDMTDGGLRGGWLVVLAARPTVGKTALAGCISLNVARRDTPALIFSLEQSRQELCERLLASLSGVPASIIKKNAGSADEQSRVCEAQNRLAGFPVVVNDRAGIKVGQIAAASRLRKRRSGLGLVVVDYLQLIEPDDKRIIREQQVATISRQLKVLAKDLDVPVLCLAQLNRGIEARENKRPGFRTCGNRERSNRMPMWCCFSTVRRHTTPKPMTPRPISSSGKTGTAKPATFGCFGMARPQPSRMPLPNTRRAGRND